MQPLTASDSGLSTVEYHALRNELLIRIFFQNSLLFLVTLLFFAAVGLSSALQGQAWLFCLSYIVASGAAVLQWCHHGIRTMQLKQYFQLRETAFCAGETWETWLPANRPRTLLGSRWLLSTKGVFIGTQISLILFCIWITSELSPLFLVLSLIGLAFTTLLLFTNPKE